MPNFQDLTGSVFGKLTALERAPRKDGATMWLCRCECGTVAQYRAGNLKQGVTRSCGCIQRETASASTVDVTGQTFTRLTAIGRAGTAPDGKALWTFRCVCGNEIVRDAVRVRAGMVKSCGCLKHDSTANGNFKHGMQGSLEYKRWESIKQRCTNPKNPSYHNYGGRGITMCPEWMESFEAFYDAVGPCPGKGLSLDRVDNNKGYEIGNVKWSTHSEQMLNRRPIVRATKAMVAELRAENERLRAELASKTKF